MRFAWAIPLTVIVFVYLIAAELYSLRAPGNRIFPDAEQLLQALVASTTPDGVRGQIPLISDTIASLSRLSIAFAITVGLAIPLSFAIFLSVMVRQMFFPLFVAFSKVPMIAILPLVLIWVGFGEFSKILLIVSGVCPILVVQTVEHLDALSARLGSKLDRMNLPASHQAVLVWLPLLAPFMIGAIQGLLGAGWLFLLVAETFGTDAGLGYRIFVLRTRVWMDVIVIYVVVIAFLSILLHELLGMLRNRLYWDWA